MQEDPTEMSGDHDNAAAKATPKNKGFSADGMNFKMPTNQGAQDHLHEKHGPGSWQYKVMKKIQSTHFQVFLGTLLFFDVLIVFVEVALGASYPKCNIIVRDAISCCPATAGTRFLQEGELQCKVGEPTDYEATCNPEKWSGVETAETVLFALTMIILSIFMIELIISIVALTPCVFFRQLFFVLDFIVVTVSFALEITFQVLDETELRGIAGLLMFFRVWRFVRIGQGFIEVTKTVDDKTLDTLLEYTEGLEEILKKNDLDVPETDFVRKLKDDQNVGTLVA